MVSYRSTDYNNNIMLTYNAKVTKNSNVTASQQKIKFIHKCISVYIHTLQRHAEYMYNWLVIST